MIVDFNKPSPRDSYPWLINAINPRPMAWVSPISAEGKTNLAQTWTRISGRGEC